MEVDGRSRLSERRGRMMSGLRRRFLQNRSRHQLQLQQPSPAAGVCLFKQGRLHEEEGADEGQEVRRGPLQAVVEEDQALELLHLRLGLDHHH